MSPYTLAISDPLCDTGIFAFEPPGFSLPQSLVPGGTDVYYCQIDAIGGAGLPVNRRCRSLLLPPRRAQGSTRRRVQLEQMRDAPQPLVWVT
jgi:hypothetical protein